ncbi:putative leucine-rich repeat-containing protein DDB_G0290503 isoform X1 [Pseudomyrmex gracilis]|uniref:putative leucine-rich repeat-containing protein DDB_G0290503 isoform X1 n=1 Tax=Pseudomyrmex gracilis TaxID=219809 RepID=UPI000995AECF|nr:putative leucine-rich repeat-containing protein DDB_G0290503 isoform X1 [Pseudomyrmex gracilis]
MDTGPGLSLFQGSNSIQLNTQRLEEDEEQEDKKRREEEIKNLMTTAFNDLENDDDASSIESSHDDSTRETDYTNTVVDSAMELITPQGHIEQQKEFDTYDAVIPNNMITNHRLDTQNDMEFYRQTETPYNKNNSTNESTVLETPFELAKPPGGYIRKVHPQLVEERMLNENDTYNYKQTPSNHYNTHIPAKYSNNGFTDTYENNVQNSTHEFGGISDHMNHCYKTSPNGTPLNDDVAYKTAEYNSKEQLEVLYMVRMKEINRLTEQMQQLQSEKDQMTRKLMMLEADVDRANISRDQAQLALVDAKAEINDLQNQIKSLEDKNAVLEKTNQNITQDLNVARGSVNDLQQKIVVLERIQALQTTDKTHEKFLKQVQEKHAVEMQNMQTQIDQLTEKLNAKEMSYIGLERKLTDERRANEILIVQKGDTMNRLAQVLEESQAQCRNLMAQNDPQQVIQLQAQVKKLTQQKDELHRHVQELQNKLELAKSDVTQYDSLLATTLENESDSMRQMKFEEHKSKWKCDDSTNKLRSELYKCMANHADKRKEINRLENTLSQKEIELNAAQQEAKRYANRVNELEEELKSVLTDQARKAEAKIKKLSDHLTDVKRQCESLRNEKINVEKKLEEALSVNEEKLKKVHQETMEQQEKEVISEYNKEYLEIHAQAIERVKQESQKEILQLSVQLEQTQKELQRVKEMYIDVCGTKEHLITEHKHEIKMMKEKYASIELHQKDIEKLQIDLETQIQLRNKLVKECEDYKNKIIELEKNLTYEKRKKEDYTKKIYFEIERAKEEALRELRNAYPNQEISVLLPDHCSEHLEKIHQLEEDCKRLEEKLQIAVEEQKKLSEYQTELNDAKITIAQMEISQETYKQKYEKVVGEKKILLSKVSKLNSEVSNMKRTAKLEGSDDVKLKVVQLQTENETLKSQCNDLLDEKDKCEKKIFELETELFNVKKKSNSLEEKLRRSDEVVLNLKSEFEKELSHYKDFIVQLSKQSNSKEGNESVVSEKRILQLLEQELRDKDEKLSRLVTDFEKIKDERDTLLVKLQNQAKQFEQYVNSQHKLSAELNLSPRNTGDFAGTDFQKMKESIAKEMREEMEKKVTKELRRIEEQKKKELEQKYQARYNEKYNEIKDLEKAIITEKMKVNEISQISQLLSKQLEIRDQELQAQKSKIEELEKNLREKENEADVDKNSMTQMMTKWITELKEIKTKEEEKDKEIIKLKEEKDREIEKLKSARQKLSNEIVALKNIEKHLKSNLNFLKHKYKEAKLTASNYKNLSTKKGEFFSDEIKRVREEYKKIMEQAQQNCRNYDEEYAAQSKKSEDRFAEKAKQCEHYSLKYKEKS